MEEVYSDFMSSLIKADGTLDWTIKVNSTGLSKIQLKDKTVFVSGGDNTTLYRIDQKKI